MKILYLIKSFAMKAGLERVIGDKMNYLAAHGHEIFLATYEQGEHPLVFPLHHTISHRDLDARFFKLEGMAILKRVFMMYKMRSNFRKRLQEFVDEVSPDVIITTTYSMKLLDIILDVNTGAHKLIESHVACHTVSKAYDYRHNPLLHVLGELYDKRTFRLINKFEKLIVLTNADGGDWRNFISDVVVIPNPVTNYPSQVAPCSGTKRIMAAGRLHEQKGFDLLIEAFSQIAPQCKEWHLDIFGEGQDRHLLESMIRQHGISDRVVIHQPTSTIYEEYQKSEFFVLSSRYEGFGLVLVEAMSCGVPCVSFRCKYGPEDIISDGKDGLLAKDGSVEDLADKMLLMITNDEMRRTMGHNARVAAKRYEMDSVMEKWNALLDSLKDDTAV